MDVQEVYDVIHKISEGFEECVLKCLDNHSGNVVIAITEQLMCGIRSDDKYIDPNYDTDDYFTLEGPWQNNSQGYKAYKKSITPPRASILLDLPPRPDNIPNLFITGKFHSEINARQAGDMLLVDPGTGDGPAIVDKFTDKILGLSSQGVAYFNTEYLGKAIEQHFQKCGYQ